MISHTATGAPHTVMIMLAVAAVYGTMAKFGFLFAIPPGNVTALFPASGVALAAMLFYSDSKSMSRAVVFGVGLGSFLANLLGYRDGTSTYTSLFSAILMSSSNAVGAMTEAYLGAMFIRCFAHTSYPFERGYDVFIFTAFGALLASMSSATIGVSALWLGGYVATDAYPYTWLTWWLGDTAGIVLITPLLLTWQRTNAVRLSVNKLWEAALLWLLMFGAAWAVFGKSLPVEYALIPFLEWAAFRFGERGAASTTVVLSLVALIATINGSGPFVRGTVNESLLLLQAFMGIIGVTALVLAGVLSERRRAADALQQLNAELEARVETRTAEIERERYKLTETNAALRAATLLKSEFLGIAAHDLKNPLQSVIGFASLIQEETPLASEVNKMATTIHSSSLKMTKIIDDLLRVTANDVGNLKLNLQPLNLSDLVQQVAALNRVQAKQKQQSLSVQTEPDAVVLADAERMREVVDNLISNAIKYSPSGGKISIGCKRIADGSEPTASCLQLRVEDEGQGLSADDMKKVFGKFQRLSAVPTGGETATGLGLWIVKQLVELHGGTVRAESAGKNQGATFYIELPCYTASPD